MTAPRMLLACVAEDRPKFHARVETLIGSARRLGGSLADSPMIVNMMQSADPAFVRRMEALGAEVRIVGRTDDGYTAHSNKLRMLELDGRDDFDIMLAVDCDIAVADDPARLVSSDAVSVVPADMDPLSDVEWRDLLAALEIEPGVRSVRATTTGRPMYPYFNSGVVAVPRALCPDLLAAWNDALRDLRDIYERRPSVVPRKRRFFADQYALMAALRRGLPFVVAGPELNFATHVTLDDATVDGLRPALLHYHDEADDEGFLFQPRSIVARAAVERVNTSRAAALGLVYGGLRGRPRRSRAHRAVVGFAGASLAGRSLRPGIRRRS
jgi:hypothetical protein